MLRCSNCGVAWEVYGRQYKRRKSNVIDYRCSSCYSKKKPIMEIEVDISTPKSIEGPKNILVVGDLHIPFCLEGSLEFCKDIYDKWDCDHVVFMGDLIDNHFSSFHATDPDGYGAGDELEYAINEVNQWSKVFPKADVCFGNHDLIILRQAYKAGTSKKWIRDFNEVLGVKWNFAPSFEYHNILFRHGISQKAAPKAASEFMNVVQCHYHNEAYIQWRVGRGGKYFGMQVPCLVDRKTYAMAYAQESPKEAIGCAVILDYGKTPIIEMRDI